MRNNLATYFNQKNYSTRKKLIVRAVPILLEKMAKIETYYCTFCETEHKPQELLKAFRCPKCKKFVACGTQIDWLLKEQLMLQFLQKIVSLHDPELLKSALLLFKIKKDENLLKLALMKELTTKLRNEPENDFEEIKDILLFEILNKK